MARVIPFPASASQSKARKSAGPSPLVWTLAQRLERLATIDPCLLEAVQQELDERVGGSRGAGPSTQICAIVQSLQRLEPLAPISVVAVRRYLEQRIAELRGV